MDEVRGYVRIGEWWVKDNYLRQFRIAEAAGKGDGWLRVYGVHRLRMEELHAPKIRKRKPKSTKRIALSFDHDLETTIAKMVENAEPEFIHKPKDEALELQGLSEIEAPRLPHQYQRLYEKLKAKSPAEAQALFNKWAYVPEVEVPMTSQAQTKAEQNTRAMKALEFAQLPADHPKKKLRRRV